jgi:lipopolysaccharide biosynthesis glycosyltransferase
MTEIKTYYACVRFIRIPEIFENTARLISLDCDGIAVRPITKEKFLTDTKNSAALWRAKVQTSLASSVFFGVDNFRNKFAEQLKLYFDNDTFKWFLDQNILDKMIANKEVDFIEFRDWGNSKIGRNTLIWTAKGARKIDHEFQNMLKTYKEHSLS